MADELMCLDQTSARGVTRDKIIDDCKKLGIAVTSVYVTDIMGYPRVYSTYADYPTLLQAQFRLGGRYVVAHGAVREMLLSPNCIVSTESDDDIDTSPEPENTNTTPVKTTDDDIKRNLTLRPDRGSKHQ